MVRIKVPATSANLGPGFDCIGMAVELYNVIEVEETDGGLEINIPEKDKNYIKADETNLVYVAMKEIFERSGYYPKGMCINLINEIPITRGLGSSAACIAGGLTAANILAGKPFDDREIINMAVEMEGHPDNVLPAMVGGVVVSCVDGGRIHYIKIDPPENIKLAVMIPDFQYPTSKSRKLLPEKIPVKDAVFNISRAALMIAAVLTGDLGKLMVATEDRIHQPYRKVFVPHWDDICAHAKELGARGIFLSGAGPTIVALLDKNYEFFQNQMRSFVEPFDEHWDIRILDPCKNGLKVTIDQ